MIALFPSTVDTDLVPAAIRTRLFVSLTDSSWKERVKAAAEGRSPNISRPAVSPYFLSIHEPSEPSGKRFTIEVRPRAGTWSPFFTGIPLSEKEAVNLGIMHGPAGRVTTGGVLFMTGEGPSNDGQWWLHSAQNEATPTQSYFISCDKLPSKLVLVYKTLLFSIL